MKVMTVLLAAAFAVALSTGAEARKPIKGNHSPHPIVNGDDHRYPGTAGAAFGGGNWGFASLSPGGGTGGVKVPGPRERCGYDLNMRLGGRYGPEMNLARNWLKFPRTTLQPGAVVVSSRKGKNKGHVVRVVSVIDRCKAIVEDSRGQYERNTCKNRLGIVQPT